MNNTRPKAGFDVGNGAFKEGDLCIVEGHQKRGVGTVSTVYQDGEAQVWWEDQHIGVDIKWRCVFPVPHSE